MARKASNSMSSRLTRFETIAGWLYLPFYLIILNLLLQLANEKLSLGMSALTINIAYFAINLAATLLIFHGFLRQSYFGGSFWNFVQAVVLGFALYYAGTGRHLSGQYAGPFLRKTHRADRFLPGAVFCLRDLHRKTFFSRQSVLQ